MLPDHTQPCCTWSPPGCRTLQTGTPLFVEQACSLLPQNLGLPDLVWSSKGPMPAMLLGWQPTRLPNEMTFGLRTPEGPSRFHTEATLAPIDPPPPML